MRKTLQETPSGNIELVDNGIFMRLEFNTTCEDALPFCKGMCCRMRSRYNTELSEEEAKSGKYKTTTFPNHPGKTFIAFKPENESCAHQDDATGHCQVQDDKPVVCGIWHCSPGGKGEGISIRGNGWFMSPIGGPTQQEPTNDQS